ncbi:hypothetical protein Q4610_01815 [Sphingobium sp. HBC34]|uniref:DUF3618 domain-containing protein n=2 Tax=Sphingobium cyanobacteriorum TaxID=3063954 RepID=A0ABT8ZJP0_9SPHN|nr:hypothetical protein [Sphingobium sp. HBC34]MDO7833771.1 hypothetical protein [Sphingobium sp. HBC34]
MRGELAYREAVARADLARAQFLTTAEEAKQRVAPARLKQDLKDRISGAALDGVARAAAQAQQRPVAIGAAAGAFVLFLARRPLTALFRRLFVRFRNPNPDYSESDDG